MARTGRPPKPVARHLLEGTYEPGRHRARAASEPEPIGELSPLPPDWLNSEQKRVWTSTLPFLTRGTVGGGDAALLASFCIAVAQLQAAAQAQSKIDEGKTLPFLINAGEKKPPVLSQYLKVIRNATETIRLVGAELGLTPIARARIGAMAFAPDAPPMRGGEDPWAAFDAPPPLRVVPGGRK